MSIEYNKKIWKTQKNFGINIRKFKKLTHWLRGVNLPVRAFKDSCAMKPPNTAHNGAKQPQQVKDNFKIKSSSISSS